MICHSLTLRTIVDIVHFHPPGVNLVLRHQLSADSQQLCIILERGGILQNPVQSAFDT